MFYLIVISNIFQIFFSFILLDQISLKKRTNLIVSVFILFLVSSVHLNLRLASLDELVLSALLLTISFMNHQRQAVGVTLFHLSFAFIVQNLAVFLLSPSSVLFYIATQASEFVIFLYFLFTLFMVVLASLAIRRFVFTRLPQKWQQYSGPILFMLFFTNKVYALYQYLLASPAETQFDTLIKMFVITLVFVVTLGGISIYIFSNNQKLAFATREKVIEQRAMQLYIDEISKQNEEINQFRHDYLNILSSLESYLEEGDLQALTVYYQQTIQPTRTLFLENASKLSALQKIDHPAIRGIFMTKLLLAQEKGISVHLEMTGKIIFPKHVFDLNLIRILGILLDNAIEEVDALGKGELAVAFFQEKDALVILIQNTVRNPVEPLYQLKKQGFSTKGKGRGYGLSTVDELMSQTSTLLLETTISQHLFVQKLTLLGGGTSA
ncbi:MAG: GHKL domain-containing protein [Enterococcus sp.]|nr:GHKL domain-containing protein [Enterococcus sp.]MBP8692771.1 GHKL domain-containing protein [Enterococcus sp.]MBP9520395.1 GHKL domain-containing protein [Enterococcus sp.]